MWLDEADAEFLSTPSARRATGIRQPFICVYVRFLSTPSARRATISAQAGSYTFEISIHALREEGDFTSALPSPQKAGISIHALREEGDRFTVRPVKVSGVFLSTPSARRATGAAQCEEVSDCISIHALREEGDSCDTPPTPLGIHFYPRPPRGGRQQKQRQNLYFQTNYTTFCTNLEEP